MYRTPIKSKNQNKTSMVKAMEPFRDSQTPLLGSPGTASMYRLNPPPPSHRPCMKIRQS